MAQSGSAFVWGTKGRGIEARHADSRIAGQLQLHAQDGGMTVSANKFHAYMRGWRHGAGFHSMDTKFTSHPTLATTYTQGWEDGRRARALASQRAAKQFSYKPSILRNSSDD